MFRSSLELHIMKTGSLSLDLLRAEARPQSPPRVLKSGRQDRGKGKGIWGSAFCLCQPPVSHSASLAVILLYDEGNYRYRFEKSFDILR